MTERVALAITNHILEVGPGPEEFITDVDWDRVAAVAISSIREPTAEMVVVGGCEHTGYYDLGDSDELGAKNAVEIWHGMIDEALK